MDDANRAPGAVAFAGGGSGGHISPGLAIAERVRELDPRRTAIFLCSMRAIDAAMLRDAAATFIPLPASSPSLRPARAWRFIRNFRASRRDAMRLLRDHRVDRVVALGGFVAAPVAVAARALGIPVTLVNLDAPPGRANRWLAGRCNLVLSAVDLSSFPRFRGWARQVVGLPVRRIALAPAPPHACRAELGLQPDCPTLLVTGASLGAASINLMMIELLRGSPGIADAFRGPGAWQVLHLTGTGAEEPVHASYDAAGVHAVVLPFLARIGLAWGAADLCISRAGANSVAEIAANAVPALFLPYPHHGDQHQVHNAHPLVAAGGAVLVIDRVNPARNAAEVGPLLRDLMNDAPRRARMRAALTALTPDDAAMTIARIVLAAGAP